MLISCIIPMLEISSSCVYPEDRGPKGEPFSKTGSRCSRVYDIYSYIYIDIVFKTINRISFIR